MNYGNGCVGEKMQDEAHGVDYTRKTSQGHSGLDAPIGSNAVRPAVARPAADGKHASKLVLRKKGIPVPAGCAIYSGWGQILHKRHTKLVTTMSAIAPDKAT